MVSFERDGCCTGNCHRSKEHVTCKKMLKITLNQSNILRRELSYSSNQSMFKEIIQSYQQREIKKDQNKLVELTR